MENNVGKQFERNFKDSCDKQGILWERYPDSNKFNFGKGTRFTTQNPCDGHIFYKGHLYYIELKSSKTGSLSFRLPPSKEQTSIKPHQIKSLLERDKYDDVHGAFIIWFCDRDTKTKKIHGGTYYIPIQKFYQWAIHTNKKSINIDDAMMIGTPIDMKKKKVNYEFNVKWLLHELQNKGENIYGNIDSIQSING